MSLWDVFTCIFVAGVPNKGRSDSSRYEQHCHSGSQHQRPARGPP